MKVLVSIRSVGDPTFDECISALNSQILDKDITLDIDVVKNIYPLTKAMNVCLENAKKINPDMLVILDEDTVFTDENSLMYMINHLRYWNSINRKFIPWSTRISMTTTEF